MIEKQNTLEWLDFIITIALDSSESEVSTISQAQYENITNQLHQKKQDYIAYLNHQTFTLSSRRKIQHLIRQQHGSLLVLLEQTARRVTRIHPLNVLTIGALQRTAVCVYDLLIFIESSFAAYLDLDDRAPDAYLAQFEKEYQRGISLVKKELDQRKADPVLIGVLLEALSAEPGGPMLKNKSFRTVSYQRELLLGLNQLLSLNPAADLDYALVELLVYLNFNSRPFMDYYIDHLSRRVQAVEPARDKIHLLMLQYKRFNQMHRRHGVRLSPFDSDLKKVISNWFTQEIGFLKEQSGWSADPPGDLSALRTAAEPGALKVLVLLSVDQIGLILRALDSLRIIKARSMNAVFQSIAPFLSTPRKADLSWDSMRSKSYAFEEKDKLTVIKVLESVITWIKEY
ncbi:hypothetical protein SAMN04487995_0927 [Dyadobacter koreensis]|uniref:Uncharacterized protein n=1 Tax=Dyadobacter koreensis TaxID=408657 RepID=A0A1H6R3M7_9BACT|nr:hypothetical protein [Dyadobacter koreensis]SEI46205.1 hypothetical protein SAMN04487995_0927 [Dyadobacter koreensis]